MTAIEPDPVAAEHLRGIDRFRVVEGVFDRDFPDAEIDLITLNKVVEHIEHPLPLLSACREKLSANGLLYVELPDLMSRDDILVANDSRVIPARLCGRKPSGGKVEVLLLKRTAPLKWEAIVGGKRLRPGVVVEIEPAGSPYDHPESDQAPVVLSLTIVEELGEARRLVEFNRPVTPHLPEVGRVPLPPYIHTTLPDGERYQTIFSRSEGSAAAPTAGLHFTPEIMLTLRQKGVILEFVTLHIGLDTFKPVTVEHVETHPIHREFGRLTADGARRINQAKLAGGRLFAVGTTAVRTLETAALRSGGQTGSLKTASTLDPNFCPWRQVVAIEEDTDLYIYPGFTFRATDALLTNFHLPRSTLLMLVSAFAGAELMRRAYNEAIRNSYRFYSFGDAMLIL